MAVAPETRSGQSRPASRVPEFGSDLIVDLLEELGIEYAAFNPGASFRGIHDSIVNYSGNRPYIVECTHEEISVAIAHGYAKASGKPMAAIVHDVVGLQHASMAIFNAWCDRVPVLVLGATGPLDSTRRRPWIDWIHTANVQATQVRDYTKWDDQPHSVAAIPESLVRAFQLATTPPCGPVYVCFDTDLQEQVMPASFPAVDLSAFPVPARPAPDPAAVRRIAEWLVGSESPVVLADRVGFDQAAVDLLVSLSELLALPVQSGTVSMNFPTQHPLNLTEAADVLAEADVVLGLECRDLFGWLNRAEPGTQQLVPAVRNEARVAHVTLDMYVTRSWASDYQRLQPGDVTVPADVVRFLDALLPLCRQLLAGDGAAGERVDRRRKRLTARSAELHASWAERAREMGGDGPLPLATASRVLWDAVKGRDFVLSSGLFGGWTNRLWDIKHTSQYLGTSGGAGLGYGLGGAIGAALGNRGNGRVILDIQSDGDALFTPSALWTMAQHSLPILVVMDNNRAYQNSVDHADRLARSRRRPVENRGVGTDITAPNVDFAGMARSFGVHGEGPVSTPEELEAALKRALRVVVEEGKPALVDALTQRR